MVFIVCKIVLINIHGKLFQFIRLNPVGFYKLINWHINSMRHIFTLQFCVIFFVWPWNWNGSGTMTVIDFRLIIIQNCLVRIFWKIIIDRNLQSITNHGYKFIIQVIYITWNQMLRKSLFCSPVTECFALNV